MPSRSVWMGRFDSHAVNTSARPMSSACKAKMRAPAPIITPCACWGIGSGVRSKLHATCVRKATRRRPLTPPSHVSWPIITWTMPSLPVPGSSIVNVPDHAGHVRYAMSCAKKVSTPVASTARSPHWMKTPRPGWRSKASWSAGAGWAGANLTRKSWDF